MMLNFFKIDLSQDDLKNDFDDEMLNLKELETNRKRVWLIIFLLIVIIIWMSVFKLDVASHSEGEVIPATQTKPIQHLEGGIVRKILIREGESVKANQKLIELETISSKTDLASIEEEIVNLKIREKRLKAQIINADSFEIEDDILKKFEQKVLTAKQILTVYNKKIDASIKTQNLKIEQQKAELNELKVRKNHLNEKLEIINKQILMNDKLMKDGLANEYERLNLLKEKTGITGGISETKASIKKINTILSQEVSNLNSLTVTQKENLELELEDTVNKLTELEKRKLKYSDTNERLIITSPIDGTVLNLNVVTEGAVVKPGGTLLSLVPNDDPLLIETKLEVGDVGLVKVGQTTRLQLLSATARDFQAITGKVEYISADRVMDDKGTPFYIVRIKPETLVFKRSNNITFPLIPGVRVQASILIGERTILDYLLSPFKSASSRALTET